MTQRILIVEDDPLTAQVYDASLRRCGFDVRIAPDGQRALDLLWEFQPTAVLLDWRLSQVTGEEFLRHVRAAEFFEALPVIVYTSGFTPEVVATAVAAGANRVLDKATLSPLTLAEAVRHLPDDFACAPMLAA